MFESEGKSYYEFLFCVIYSAFEKEFLFLWSPEWRWRGNNIKLRAGVKCINGIVIFNSIFTFFGFGVCDTFDDEKEVGRTILFSHVVIVKNKILLFKCFFLTSAEHSFTLCCSLSLVCSFSNNNLTAQTQMFEQNDVVKGDLKDYFVSWSIKAIWLESLETVKQFEWNHVK